MEREERRRFAMIKIALVIGLAFVIQFVLSSFQMKNFNNEICSVKTGRARSQLAESREDSMQGQL